VERDLLRGLRVGNVDVAREPLAEIVRARNHAYRLANEARNPAPEPDGSEAPG
jgi:hypothetical protein